MTIRPDTEIRHIGEKTFSEDDQRLFALVSRDRNPMHMDAIAARRLITGRQVVHGVHVLIAAIERWQNGANSPAVSLSCTFNNPVSVGDEVVFTQDDQRENEVTIEAAVKGLLCARIIIGTSPDVAQRNTGPGALEDGARQEVRFPEGLANPLDHPAEFHLDRKYVVRLNDADFSAQFPRSYRLLGRQGFAALAALSYFVGMICPGLHSIFSALTLEPNRNAGHDDLLAFSVRKYDNRVRLFDISFRGCMQGSIKAFLRSPPQPQLTLGDLSAYVTAGEFSGTRSLIIGGSRGLGELTAKILAAGSGNVVITYAAGSDDAARVGAEINAAGKSTCETLKLDLTSDPVHSMKIDRNSLDVVYFFATPRIFRKKVEIFEPGLLREFQQFYVQRFYDLCVYLEAGTTAKKIRVYFPSTVFVADRPRGMTEYSMAKASAEVLIEEINKSFEKVSVLSTRLPRLNTDQTSSIAKQATASNLESLLPIIRSLHK